MNPNEHQNPNNAQQNAYPNPNAGYAQQPYSGASYPGQQGAFPPNYPQMGYPQPPFGYGMPQNPYPGPQQDPNFAASQQAQPVPPASSQPPVEDNTFVTTDVPDVEAVREQTKTRRLFYVLLGICVVLIALVAWEIVDMIFRLA